MRNIISKSFAHNYRLLSPKFRSLREDQRGNITILFAFSLLPLLGCTGLAFDFGSMLLARYACQTAADAAALYASGVAKNLIQNSDGSAASVTAAFGEATIRAEALFDAHVTRNVKTSLWRKIEMSQKGLQIVATTNFTVSTGAALGKLFGVQNFSSAGMAESAASLPAFTNLWMALDISQSMGLASTTSGAQLLFKKVAAVEKANGNSNPVGCVFGCHVIENGKKSPYTYQEIANTNNVELRIDVLRNAVSETISTAQSNATTANTTNYQISLYTMGLSSSNGKTYGLNQLQALSNNWSTLQTAASKIDLGPNNSGGTGDSYFSEPLNELRGKMLPGGDGTSAAKAKQFLFIITDGLRDVAGNCTSGHCTAAFDPSACTTFKSANITVAVIYTTYLPILKDPTSGSTTLESNYVALVQPYAAQIAPNLKSCASPGWYAEASDGPAIRAALATMFGRTAQQATLTF
jgi:Flp pilus assembly protein TadG